MIDVESWPEPLFEYKRCIGKDFQPFNALEVDILTYGGAGRGLGRGEPRSKAMKDWLVNGVCAKRLSHVAKANPETPGDHFIMNRSILLLSRVLLECLDGFHDDYRFEEHVFQAVVQASGSLLESIT